LIVIWGWWLIIPDCYIEFNRFKQQENRNFPEYKCLENILYFQNIYTKEKCKGIFLSLNVLDPIHLNILMKYYIIDEI